MSESSGLISRERQAANAFSLLTLHPDSPAPATEPGMQIIRRNGTVSPFDGGKISVAMTKAFLAVEGHGAAGLLVERASSRGGRQRAANPAPA